MNRDLAEEYRLLKEQRSKGLLTADEYVRGLTDIGQGYIQALEENGVMPPRPLEVEIAA